MPTDLAPSSETAPADKTSRSNKVLGQQLSDACNDYVKYVSVDTAATDRRVNDGVESLLVRLDEFEQLLEFSRSDANVCLFKHVPNLQAKFIGRCESESWQ